MFSLKLTVQNLRPEQGPSWLATGGVGILLLAVAVIIGLDVFSLRPIWNLALEGSLATYFHSGILMAIAATFWAVFALMTRWRRPERASAMKARHWLLGGFAFMYLSLDEAVEVHELVFSKTFRALGLWDKVLHYDLSPALWVVLFAPLFMAIAVLILVVLFNHRRQVRVSFRLGLGAMALWGTALVLEFVQLMYLRDLQPWFGVAVHTEEIAELLGSTAFLLALALIARHLLAVGPASEGG